MRALRSARIVVAADEISGRPLVGALNRMRVPQVTLVTSMDEARSLCRDGAADACLVVIRNFSIEEPPARSVEDPAPAASSILLADVVTPYVRRTARRSGYARVAARAVTPRLLYRLIGGALQKARRPRMPLWARGVRFATARPRRAREIRFGMIGRLPWPGGGPGKVKLSS